MVSSIPALKKALLARLTTDLASLSEVHYGADSEKMGDDILLIGKASNPHMDYLAAMTAANESYDIEIISSVVGPIQALYSSLVDRAFAINDAAVASVLAWKDADYGGVVDIIVPMGAADDEAVGDGWHEAAVTQTLHVTARI